MTASASLAKKKILVTGAPGIGKTTLIKKISDELKDLHPVGFYTDEIRGEGIRKGFELISLDGRKGILSRIDLRSPHRVGKYSVDIEGFEDFLDSIPFSSPSTHLVIIDEIGKMECLSGQFRKCLKELLNSDKWVIATIALKGSGLIEEIKGRNDMKLFEITKTNRDSLLCDIIREVTSNKLSSPGACR